MRLATCLLPLFCALFLGLSASGQIGNEWIDYNAQYWHLPVVEDGVQRLEYNQLQNAGFPVNGLSSADLQVYSRGSAQRIQIVDGGDGTFDQGDYVLFRVQKNDGWLDREIYQTPGDQNNPHYSNFNDTARVYITRLSGVNLARTALYSSTTPIETLPQIDYVLSRSLGSYHEGYFFGVQDQNGFALPWYQEAEGWYDSRFGKGQTRSKDLPTPNAYQGNNAPFPKVKAVSASASLASGIWNHHLQVGYGNTFIPVIDTVYYGYQLNSFAFDLPNQNLDNITRISHRSVDDLGVATDYHVISNIEITYARNLDFGAVNKAEFVVQNPGGNEALLNISAFGGTNPRCFVVEQNGFKWELPLTENNGELLTIVPFEGASSRELLLIDESLYANEINLDPVSSSAFFTNYLSAPVDSAMIIITHPKLFSSANNYAAYKNNSGLPCVVVDVNQLYHQYAAGIYKHPLSIRRFCEDLLNTWPVAPSHLFFLGKSIHEMNISSTVGARNNEDKYARNLVPSYGHPTSDLAFTAGLNGTLYEAAIPSGRLSAVDNEAVLDYLNKVVEFESAERAEWMKNVLHFGGGGNQFEQSLFRGYLENYENIVEDVCFGGDVFSFYKSSTDPIQISVSDSIQLLIEEGVSLMTFFGHASSTGFDVNIDSPATYDNQGKYPLLIGNSCYTGNIHLSQGLSTSEEFVLAPNAGVIGFIAKGDLGLPSYLNTWTSSFYDQVFRTNYGKSLGQCMVGAVQAFQGNFQNLYSENAALTFALHGDPSIVLNSWPKPDLVVAPEDISFVPENLNSALDNFEVHVNITNIGKLIESGFGLELVRHFPDGSDTSIFIDIEQMAFQNEVVFNLPLEPLRGLGVNTFDVYVDYPSIQVDEMENATNNIVIGKSINITSGNIFPVYPYEYSVIPEVNGSFYASTGDPLSELKPYRFQIDKAPTFDSPAFQEEVLMGEGGLLAWEPGVFWEEGVYYWRCSPDSSAENDFDWRSSSFEILNSERGWGQADYGQFIQNQRSQLSPNAETESINFFSAEVPLKATVYGSPENTFESSATRYLISGQAMEYAGCGGTPALHVAVMDSSTLIPWASNYDNTYPENDFGNVLACANARQRPENYFIFRQNDAAQLQGMVNMIENSVEDGHYLLIYTWQYVDYDGWENNAPEVFDMFANLGANQVGLGQDSVPFIFFMEKGNPESIVEVVGSAIDSYLELEALMTGTLGSGRMETRRLGVSPSWERFEWQAQGNENDELRLELKGRSLENTPFEVAEYDNLSGEVLNLAELIDGNEYPYIEIDALLRDEEDQSAPQLDHWRLLGTHAPECALNAAVGYYFPKDSLMAGEDLAICIAVSNAGELPMDSILMSYTIEKDGLIRQEKRFRLDSLRVGEHLIDTVYLSTIDLVGAHTLKVEANAFNPELGTYDQLEQYRFNNHFQRNFTVLDDRINPLLEVTFDGRRILNGDIVSAAPLIRVSLDDENPYLLMNQLADTSSFKMYVQHPNGEQKPVFFANENEVLWLPAGEDNKVAFEYRPQFEQDGKYRLLVQAQDKSGNSSGDLDYTIDFEVITENSITDVLNYPNPFTTRTQFVFTLTGNTPPDEIYIQIMNISGRVVREIRTEEFGPMIIGRNRSEYWWDGRDQYGDPLANGVYLYRVVAKLNGVEVKHRDSGASAFFTKGIGKMYLMR